MGGCCVIYWMDCVVPACQFSCFGVGYLYVRYSEFRLCLAMSFSLSTVGVCTYPVRVWGCRYDEYDGCGVFLKFCNIYVFYLQDEEILVIICCCRLEWQSGAYVWCTCLCLHVHDCGGLLLKLGMYGDTLCFPSQCADWAVFYVFKLRPSDLLMGYGMTFGL